MNVTENQFDEWLENPVTIEMGEYLDKWIENIKEALLMASQQSSLNTADDAQHLISFIRDCRIKIDIYGMLKNIDYEDLSYEKDDEEEEIENV